MVRCNHAIKRLNKEVKRRTDVVGIFPNDRSVVRLVGAILTEQNDAGQVARRYFSAESVGGTIPAGRSRPRCRSSEFLDLDQFDFLRWPFDVFDGDESDAWGEQLFLHYTGV